MEMFVLLCMNKLDYMHWLLCVRYDATFVLIICENIVV